MSNAWDGIDPDDANTIRTIFERAVEDAVLDVQHGFGIEAEQADAIFADWVVRSWQS